MFCLQDKKPRKNLFILRYFQVEAQECWEYATLLLKLFKYICHFVIHIVQLTLLLYSSSSHISPPPALFSFLNASTFMSVSLKINFLSLRTWLPEDQEALSMSCTIYASVRDFWYAFSIVTRIFPHQCHYGEKISPLSPPGHPQLPSSFVMEGARGGRKAEIWFVSFLTIWSHTGSCWEGLW